MFALASLALFLYTSLYYVVLPLLANGFFEPLGNITNGPSSNTPKPNDSLRSILEMLATSKTNVEDGQGISSQFVDLNGDGLVDFIHMTVGPDDKYQNPIMGVMKNNGNYSFGLIYQCAVSRQGSPPVYRYWGDCAAI